MRAGFGAMLAALALMTAAADAQIVVSANDGKQLRPGELPESRTADSVSVLRLGPSPKLLATIIAPTSMIGPPASVALAHDGSFALVTSGLRLEPSDPTGLAPADVVSVIDLADPAAPKVVQTVKAGLGAMGVTINRAGKLALVAGSSDDSVTMFAVAGKRLTQVGRVQLEAKGKPTDVVFMPDGRSALVVLQTAGKVLRLTVDGTSVRPSGAEFVPGRQPYGVTIDRQGTFAYTNNLGGRANGAAAVPGGLPRMGTVGVLDLRSGRVAGEIEVGVTPEHVLLSPDGRYLHVTLLNGSASAPGSPNHNPFGLLKVYRVRGSALALVAEARTGKQCQGAAWSGDGRTIALQCAVDKEIEVYRFDGKALIRNQGATMKFTGRPGAMATAGSR